MKPLAKVTSWSVALAFLGGFAGTDAWGVLLVAMSAYLQGCADPYKPWRWATLTVAGWAAGSLIVMLTLQTGTERYFEVPDATASNVVVLVALSAAYLGAALTWAAGRLARER